MIVSCVVKIFHSFWLRSGRITKTNSYDLTVACNVGYAYDNFINITDAVSLADFSLEKLAGHFFWHLIKHIMHFCGRGYGSY